MNRDTTRWIHRHPDVTLVVVAKYKDILDVMNSMSINELTQIKDEYDESYMDANMDVADYHTLRFCIDVIKGIAEYPKWKKRARNSNFKLNRGKNDIHI